MSGYEEKLELAIARPNDDGPRQELRVLLSGQYPEWSRFIECQLEEAQRRRRRGWGGGDGFIEEHHALLASRKDEWERQLRKYCLERPIYDRGLPTLITIDPEMLLEYGGHILKMAPIRHLNLVRQESEFSYAEFFACPHLATMESLQFSEDLTRAEREAMAASPYLGNLAYLGIDSNDVKAGESPEDYFDLLASSPHLRQVLYLERSPRLPRMTYYPGDWKETFYGEFYGDGETERFAWRPPNEQGQALERKYGYIPWLHPRLPPDGNACPRLDAAYHRDRGALPVRPVGAPV